VARTLTGISVRCRLHRPRERRRLKDIVINNATWSTTSTRFLAELHLDADAHGCTAIWQRALRVRPEGIRRHSPAPGGLGVGWRSATSTTTGTWICSPPTPATGHVCIEMTEATRTLAADPNRWNEEQPDGIGARVSVDGGGARRSRRCGTSPVIISYPRPRFCSVLGGAVPGDAIEVRWPGARWTSLVPWTADRSITIRMKAGA